VCIGTVKNVYNILIIKRKRKGRLSDIDVDGGNVLLFVLFV
jgi:hypothetical protein